MPKPSRPARWIPAIAVTSVAVAALGTVLAARWGERHGPDMALQAQQGGPVSGPAAGQAGRAPADADGLKRDADCRDCAEPRRLQEDRS